MMLTTDGHVFALGTNSNFRLALPDNRTKYLEPTQVPIQNVTTLEMKRGRVLFVCADNSLHGCGDNTKYALGITDKDYLDAITKLPSKNYQDERILFVTTAYSFSIVITECQNLFLLGNKCVLIIHANFIVG